jgi:hypothetical protein
MGQTGADFGAVSTEGLVMRVRRVADKNKVAIEKALLLTRNGKRQRKAVIDATLAAVDHALIEIRAGRGSEQELRAALIALLDPRMGGGERHPTIRW